MTKVVQRFAIAAMSGVASGVGCARAVGRSATRPAGTAQPLLFARAGNAANTEGGAGAADDTAAPPDELSRDPVNRANQAAPQHGQRHQQFASAPHGASRAC
ncbi:hypothetical protein [Paraburkholderia sp. HD33-4]|uniref:hypothetical protein n=1 Tax=Paraburkholderia sp. HD33-4 TaxID=2883242 RepID=UPI001F22DBB4|nr:hypothetical protein [Paraburkholderia sp. HD33-4]